MGAYLKNSIWDMAICLALVVSLGTALVNGFTAGMGLAESWYRSILPAALMVLLFTMWFYSLKTLIAGFVILGGGVLTTLILTTARHMALFSDSTDNRYLPYLLLFLVAIGVFLLSRTGAGNAIMLAAGVFLLCLVQLLYGDGRPANLFVFLCAAGIMQVYRYYIRNVIRTNTVEAAPGRAVLCGLALCLLVVLAGTGIFYGVIRPAKPPVQEITLFTRFLSMDVLERIGAVARIDQPDPSQETSMQNDDEEVREDQEADADHQDEDDQESTPESAPKGNAPVFGIRHVIERIGWIIWPIVIAVIILLLFLGKLVLRRNRYARIRQLDPAGQVRALYRFFLGAFARIGVARNGEETPYEFARRAQPLLAEFRTGDTSFAELTETYVNCAYGTLPVSDRELSAYHGFYRNFYKNCRKQLGGLKYMRMFFRI